MAKKKTATKVEEPVETSAPEPVTEAETEDEAELVEPVVVSDSIEKEVLTEKEVPAVEKKSLNDRLAGNMLKFGLNDRIGFVKDLFDGSQEDFNRVVSQLNTLGNLNEAMEFIHTHISREYGWDQKEETAARFIAAVEQKFS